MSKTATVRVRRDTLDMVYMALSVSTAEAEWQGYSWLWKRLVRVVRPDYHFKGRQSVGNRIAGVTKVMALLEQLKANDIESVTIKLGAR